MYAYSVNMKALTSKVCTENCYSSSVFSFFMCIMLLCKYFHGKDQTLGLAHKKQKNAGHEDWTQRPIIIWTSQKCVCQISYINYIENFQLEQTETYIRIFTKETHQWQHRNTLTVSVAAKLPYKIHIQCFVWKQKYS